jgi:hypothetical protein
MYKTKFSDPAYNQSIISFLVAIHSLILLDVKQQPINQPTLFLLAHLTQPKGSGELLSPLSVRRPSVR